MTCSIEVNVNLYLQNEGSLDFSIDQILDMFEDIQSELRQEGIENLSFTCH